MSVPSYRTDAAQQRGQSEEVNRQNQSTINRQEWLTRDKGGDRLIIKGAGAEPAPLLNIRPKTRCAEKISLELVQRIIRPGRPCGQQEQPASKRGVSDLIGDAP